jgi:hypothetical protein
MSTVQAGSYTLSYATNASGAPLNNRRLSRNSGGKQRNVVVERFAKHNPTHLTT